MKPLLFGLISSCILLFSCATEIKYINSIRNFYAVDFTEYSRQDFLITPEKYTGNYESIGLLEYEFYPSAELKVTEIEDEQFGNYERKLWVVSDYDIDEGINILFNEARLMGADALINFEIIPQTRYAKTETGMVVEASGLQIDGYIVRGFAIKRE